MISIQHVTLNDIKQSPKFCMSSDAKRGLAHKPMT